jgi:hypothetical protein
MLWDPYKDFQWTTQAMLIYLRKAWMRLLNTEKL